MQNVARFLYQAKASRREKNLGLEELPKKASRKMSVGNFKGRTTGTHSRVESNNHPCVKSLKLMNYLITMVTPPGGTVLDCFAGSGTTLVAAKRAGFKYVGIEREREYVQIIKARLKAVK